MRTGRLETPSATSPARTKSTTAAAPRPDNEASVPVDTQDTQDIQDALVALEGNTYGIRAELKTLGAVWDVTGRVWRIAAEMALQAQALMDSQPEEPQERAGTAGGTNPVDELSDPFEEEAEAVVALSGNGFAVKDALKVLGARWDKEQRAWVTKQSKAARAQALIDVASNAAVSD